MFGLNQIHDYKNQKEQLSMILL